MSFLGKFLLYRCDYCGKQDHGMRNIPVGWIWVKTGGPIKHACPQCRDKVPKEQQREPGKLS